MIILDTSLPRQVPILRGAVTCTLCPADLYAIDQRPHLILGLVAREPTLVVTRTLSESLWSHTFRFIVHLDLNKWTDCCLENFSQIVLCFKYANNELPGV